MKVNEYKKILSRVEADLEKLDAGNLDIEVDGVGEVSGIIDGIEDRIDVLKSKLDNWHIRMVSARKYSKERCIG